MKRISTAIFFASAYLSPHLVQGQSYSFDEKLNDAFMPIALAWESLVLSEIQFGSVGIPVVLILLLSGALFFTLYFKGINVFHFWTAIRVVRGHFDFFESKPVQSDVKETIKNESLSGEVNHFQALATAVSGTVGLGNIAMVAVAISLGGPGATFWMIIAGILGMSTKFVECTLGVLYRDIDSNGRVYGGPMYYMTKGIKNAKLGKFLAIVFAVFCIGASFGGGNAFQSNQASAQIITRFGLEGANAGTFIGIVFAIVVGIVILGGIRRIAQVTEKIVPVMAIIYVMAALFIITANYTLIDDVLSQIFTEAFQPRSTVVGGIIGVAIQGFRRAAFSNEAGAGSASIAHAAVKTKYAASEGLVALLEPFIDTVLICTMTAFVIIMFNQEGFFTYGDVLNNEVLMISSGDRVGGVNLTSMAFDHAIPGFSYVLAIAVVLFSFSTMLSWSYYGMQSWAFLFGRSKGAELTYKLLFLLFTILGAAVTLEAVIKFSDAMILALVFPNMIALFLLFRKVKPEISSYLQLIKTTKS